MKPGKKLNLFFAAFAVLLPFDMGTSLVLK
jgi:hypothetical protein